MDVEKIISSLKMDTPDWPLREKNLRTILEFMPDGADGESGDQHRKRLNRHKLYAEGGRGYRYGAGYFYSGEARLKERDETTVRRFPLFVTLDMQVFQCADPNVFLVTGHATGNQYDDAGNFIRDIPPADPVHNLFIMEDGLIKEYVEYCIEATQYPHDVSDIAALRAKGMDDQIMEGD